MNNTNSKAKHWCITAFQNFEDIENLLAESEDSPFTAVCYQEEKSPITGRLHLQIFVSFKERVTSKKIKDIFGKEVHYAVARGTPEQNRIYCSKDETRNREGATWGDFRGQGRRNDLESAAASIKVQPSFKKFVEENTSISIKYFGSLEKVHKTLHSYTPAPNPLFTKSVWMAWLDRELSKPANNRRVIWVVDRRGNIGKTMYSIELYSRRPEEVYITGITKGDRQAFAYEGQGIVIFDVPRCSTPEEGRDMFPYQQLEHFKNGFFPPGMYGSATKMFRIPHVVVMSNWEPHLDKLSTDRWCIVELDGVDWKGEEGKRVIPYETLRMGRTHVDFRLPDESNEREPRLPGGGFIEEDDESQSPPKRTRLDKGKERAEEQ